MAAPVLSYEGLGLVQGTGWLFRDLNLYIGERDRLALIGRNGAGKTTLMRLIADQIEADAGRRVIVPGTNVVMLEQNPKLEGFATLLDFVLSGADAPPRHEAEAIADQLGIDLSRPAATASGGERRRAAIARALAQNPDVLLLDEPTNHLDIRHQLAILDLVGSLGVSIVIALHDLNQAMRCDRLAVLQDGRLQALGPPAEILDPALLARVFGVRASALIDPQDDSRVMRFHPC